MPKTVLVVVAHPDDEVLGCGGTLAKHVDDGDTVHIIWQIMRNLQKDAQESLRKLAPYVSDITFKKAPAGDQEFDCVSLLRWIEQIEHFGYDPDIVYTHWPYDLNKDHSVTAQAVLTVFRPKPETKPRKILAFETLSSTEWSHGYRTFEPNHYVPLTYELVDKKADAMLCYKTECEEFPHPRSEQGIFTKALLRGMECGHKYAEAFHLIRSVEG